MECIQSWNTSSLAGELVSRSVVNFGFEELVRNFYAMTNTVSLGYSSYHGYNKFMTIFNILFSPKLLLYNNNILNKSSYNKQILTVMLNSC